MLIEGELLIYEWENFLEGGGLFIYLFLYYLFYIETEIKPFSLYLYYLFSIVSFVCYMQRRQRFSFRGALGVSRGLSCQQFRKGSQLDPPVTGYSAKHSQFQGFCNPANTLPTARTLSKGKVGKRRSCVVTPQTVRLVASFCRWLFFYGIKWAWGNHHCPWTSETHACASLYVFGKKWHSSETRRFGFKLSSE